MTALDQAFIKAFTRQDATPLAFSMRPAAPPSALNLASSSASMGDVWAALEKPSKAIASLLNTKGQPVGAGQEEESAVDSGQSAAGNEQWAIASMQYFRDTEPTGSSPESQEQFPESSVPLSRAEDELHSCKQQLVDGENKLMEAAPVPSPAPLIPSPEPRALCSGVAAVERADFRPAWQVNQFTWPRVCRRLIARAAEELDRLADALLAANAQGQKVLAIGGCCRGEGATTLLLCAARRLAERGIKSVLVDADLGRPRLAKRLGVQTQLGWDETTEEEGRTLDQAIVEATSNNVALLPAREPPTENGCPVSDLSRLPGCLDILQTHYDMVLVDLGPLENAGLADGAVSRAIADAIDAVVLVHNRRITPEERLSAFAQQLAAVGIGVVGVVENFVVED